MWKQPPPSKDYYAVIFSSIRSDYQDGYLEMDALTMQIAQEQEGFLGFESCHNGKQGIFISYWNDLESITKWRHNMTHLQAKNNANQWYKRYLIQICKVESSDLFVNK